MEELTDLVEVASTSAGGHIEETARAELRLITPTVRKVYKRTNLTKHFKDLLKMAKTSKKSVDYRGAVGEATKVGKKSPSKPIIKKKMKTMDKKAPIKTKGQKGKI